MGLQSEQKKVGRHALAFPPLVDLDEVRGYLRSNAYNYVQIRGGEYRFFSLMASSVWKPVHISFFSPHNLFRPPHEPVPFLSPVLDQKSGAGPKIRGYKREKKKSQAGESVGAMCRKQTPAFLSLCHHLIAHHHPGTHPTSRPAPPTHSALCVLHTAHFHLRRTINRAPYHFKADTWSALPPSPAALVLSICKIRATLGREMAAHRWWNQEPPPQPVDTEPA